MPAAGIASLLIVDYGRMRDDRHLGRIKVARKGRVAEK